MAKKSRWKTNQKRCSKWPIETVAKFVRTGGGKSAKTGNYSQCQGNKVFMFYFRTAYTKHCQKYKLYVSSSIASRFLVCKCQKLRIPKIVFNNCALKGYEAHQAKIPLQSFFEQTHVCSTNSYTGVVW